MITVIGASSTVTGFGLCGIKDIHELGFSAGKEEVLKKLFEAKGEIILIDELLLKRAGSFKTDKIIIKIPYRFKEGDSSDDFLEELMKDTIGGSIKL